MKDLDQTDVKILDNLLDDARDFNRQIARKMGVSVGTVIAKTRKMDESGIIKGYSAILDHDKLGYELTVLAEITMSRGR